MMRIIGGQGIPTLVYTATDGYNGPNANRTFAGVAIGAVPTKGDRLVIVAVLRSSTGVTTSVTIGGVSATQVVAYDLSTNHGYLYAAVVNTGTTADIVVNSDDNTTTLQIGVWAAYDLRSTTATDTDSGGDSVDSDGPQLSATVEGRGIAIMAAWGATAASGWNQLSEDFDETREATRWAGASASDLAAGTVTEDPTGVDRVRVLATWR